MSPLLGFIAAIAIYAIALAVFMSFTSTPPTESSTIDADLQNRAGSALDLVITDSGACVVSVTCTTGEWVSDPDHMSRFGLTTEDPNFIDYDKIEALREGKMAADATNGYPDYPEVKTALGLTDHQFHLRTYPVLVSVDDANWAKMRGFNVAYVADVVDPDSTATTADSSDTAANTKVVKLTVTNTHTSTMIFSIHADLEVDAGKHVTTTRQTRPLDQFEAETIEVEIHPLKQWDAEPIEVVFSTTDNYGACSAADGCDDESLTVTPHENGALTYETHLLAETAASYYLVGETVKIRVDHFDKDGDKEYYQDAKIEVFRPTASGAETQEAVAMATVLCSVSCPVLDPPGGGNPAARQLPWINNDEWEHTCSCADRKGLWKVVVSNPVDATRDVTFYYWVNDVAMFTSNPPDAVADLEIEYISDLVEGFDTDVYSATVGGEPNGDVYIDTNQDVRDITPFVDVDTSDCDPGSHYDMVIVGSNTAHNSLVKLSSEIGNFVECGGTLIALGSSRSGTTWLESVYSIALSDGAGGGISSPDPTHPLLNVPEKLAWNSYSDTDYVWDISQNPGLFSHAVDGATGDELMLGVSEQGALPGSVVLTGWTPGDLTTPQDDDEAKRILHNLMTQGYQMLFLDYGPEIPDGTPVGSSSRLAAVEYTAIEDAPFIEVKVVLYAWRG